MSNVTDKRDPGVQALPTMVEIFVEHRPAGVDEPTEEAAFADLYNRTYHPLVAYCRRYCPPGYDPEDIAQEALSRAWSSWDRYSPSRPFWPWVATIARRLCVDYWRRDERALARSAGTPALEPVVQLRPDELSEAADECRLAVSAFRRLRPDHQRIVGLRDIEGWSYEDIARFEGVTVESVRGSLRRARVSLRKSYETLAKGGVPAIIPLPLVPFLRRFQAARSRLAVRMARWQATFHDTGVASTRLGEAMVSLMALSVAAVGFGSPGAPAVAALAASPRSSTGAASGSQAAAPTGGADTAVNGAGAAGTVVHSVQSAAPEWKKTEADWKPTSLLSPAPKASTDDSSVVHFTVSPNFAQDHTIFAVATPADGCPTGVCWRLFESTDAGVTWISRNADNLVGDRVVLPPNYGTRPGQDPRVFATGQGLLQRSVTSGDSFDPLTPSLGVAVMSPAFSSGDPNFYLGDAPGRTYNADNNSIKPMQLQPAPESTSNQLSFAFPSTFDPANPLMFVAAMDVTTVGHTGTVMRCIGGHCDTGRDLPGITGSPTLVVSRAASGDVLYAYSGQTLYRSLDDGLSFMATKLPAGAGGVMDMTAGAGGEVYLVTRDAQTTQAEVWHSSGQGAAWSRIPTASVPADSIRTLTALGDGTLLLGMAGTYNGLACSHDQGRTWLPHC